MLHVRCSSNARFWEGRDTYKMIPVRAFLFAPSQFNPRGGEETLTATVKMLRLLDSELKVITRHTCHMERELADRGK